MGIANLVNGTVELGVRVGIGAIVGGVAAAITMPVLGIPVLTGAVFCGSEGLTGKIVDCTLGKLFNLKGTSGLTHGAGRVITVLVSVGAAVCLASVMGFPITMLNGLAILGVILLAELIAYTACKVISGLGHQLINGQSRTIYYEINH